eukprot:10908993-Alexandrium_andersonii.AAC.1
MWPAASAAFEHGASEGQSSTDLPAFKQSEEQVDQTQALRSSPELCGASWSSLLSGNSELREAFEA